MSTFVNPMEEKKTEGRTEPGRDVFGIARTHRFRDVFWAVLLANLCGAFLLRLLSEMGKVYGW